MSRVQKTYGGPVELAAVCIGGKWKTVILGRLKEDPLRCHELRARMPGIADKVLTGKLRGLERLGLVTKAPIDWQQSPSVHRPTARGAGAGRAF